MSDHPDIIWVNEYPDSSGVTHPSRAKAEANVIHDGTTAAYQRLPDGVDPETHEQVDMWGAYKGWMPKPQPEPSYVPAPKDIFEVDGVRYQRRAGNTDLTDGGFYAWNFHAANDAWFKFADIESGDVVCVKVEADD